MDCKKCPITTSGKKEEWSALCSRCGTLSSLDIGAVNQIDPKSSYYDVGGISTMAVIKAKLTDEQFKGFLLGNQIKYSCRLNYKCDPKRDAEKAANYGRLLSELE